MLISSPNPLYSPLSRGKRLVCNYSFSYYSAYYTLTDAYSSNNLVISEDLRTSYCSCLFLNPDKSGIHQAYRGMSSSPTHRRRGIPGRGPALDLSEILSDLPRIGTETSNYKTSAFNCVNPNHICVCFMKSSISEFSKT